MSRQIAYIGCFFVAAAVGCMILAFASPYWVESFAEFTGNRLVKCGLWEFCFNDYTFYKDHNGKRYLGCFYIFSDVIRPLWEWLSPPWFVAMQVMVSVGLLIQVVTATFLILYVFQLFKAPEVQALVLMATSAAMAFALVDIFIVLVVFGVKKEDRLWIPRPDMNYLSWSYGLCCLSGFASLFSALALFKAYLSFEYEKSPPTTFQ